MPALALRAAVALAAAALLARGGRAPAPAALRAGDYIVAVVNQELVTDSEVQQRMARVREERGAQRQPRCRPQPSCASRCSTR